jgi:tetratricopeptide (TPR) repeat protein
MIEEKKTLVRVPASPSAGVLRIEKGQNVGRAYPVAHEITIGRNQENTIVLSDTAVSRHHAKIAISGNEVTIADLKSGNGTRVNGNLVTKQALTNGDKIEIGDTTFVFHEGDKGKKGSSDRKRPLLLLVLGIVIVASLAYFWTSSTRGKQEDFDAHFAKAKTHYAERNWGACLTELHECHHLQPENARIIAGIEKAEKQNECQDHIQTALSYLESNKLEAAAEQVEQARSIFPDNDQVDSLLVILGQKEEYGLKIAGLWDLVAAEQYDTVLKKYEELTSTHGRSEELDSLCIAALKGKSHELEAAGKLKEAIALLDRAIGMKPDDKSLQQEKKQTRVLPTKPKKKPHRPPVIERLWTHVRTLEPGRSTKLHVKALDPDGSRLTYSWKASSGTIKPTDAETVTYTAPRSGNSAVIKVVVRNARGLSTHKSIALTIAEEARVPDELLQEAKAKLGKAEGLEGYNPEEYKRLLREVVKLLGAYPNNEYYKLARKKLQQYEE